MSQAQKKPNLRRKNSISEEDRTDDRDDAANYIEDMWPATLSEISDESGYSISHIHNTLNLYFERYTDEESQSGRQSRSNGSNDTQSRATTRGEQKGQQGDEKVPEQVREKRHEVDIPEIYLDSPQMLQAYLHGWGDGYIEGRSDCLDQRDNSENGSGE